MPYCEFCGLLLSQSSCCVSLSDQWQEWPSLDTPNILQSLYLCFAHSPIRGEGYYVQFVKGDVFPHPSPQKKTKIAGGWKQLRTESWHSYKREQVWLGFVLGFLCVLMRRAWKTRKNLNWVVAWSLELNLDLESRFNTLEMWRIFPPASILFLQLSSLLLV